MYSTEIENILKIISNHSELPFINLNFYRKRLLLFNNYKMK